MAKDQDKQLKADAAARRHDVAAQLSDQAIAHADMAKAQSERLMSDAAARRHDVAVQLSNQAIAHATMAKHQNKQLKTDAAAMRHDVAAQLKDQAKAHVAMAKEQHAHLSKDMAHLVANGKAESKERQAEAAARRTEAEVRTDGWASLNNAMTSRRGGAPVKPKAVKPAHKPPAHKPPAHKPPAHKPIVAAPKASVVAPKATMSPSVAPIPQPVTFAHDSAPTISAERTHDDLTVIRGIGLGMQSHLNNIGVFTFRQLATADVDQLRKELGEVARLARIEEWKAEAQKLV
jgi:predicted flap endonuclease-1-like 5' DNA nuclease